MADARRQGVSRLDAELLLARLLGRPRSALIAHDDQTLDDRQADRWRDLLAQRAGGVPLAYLLGEKEFFGHLLAVTPAVLVPRPETELLVEWAAEILAEAGAPAHPAVADLGTGSGAIALAVKHLAPHARVAASDISAAALAVAAANARRLGLDIELLEGAWWRALAERRFDLVLANPPYLDAADPHLPALRHEPRQALTPGADGLAALAEIVRGAPPHLVAGGWLVVEHGCEQASPVRSMFRADDWTDVSTRTDLAGLPRATGGRRRPPRR
ncbi:MAG: peptide chain release factor N(5)-glutamine methyltransferase [Caldimonas sp.]